MDRTQTAEIGPLDTAQTEEIRPLETSQTALPPASGSDMSQAAILSTLRGVAAEWLQVPPDEVDTSVTFQELGAGSIVLVDTIRVIHQTFGVRIKGKRFFEDLTTIDALAAYLAEETASEPLTAENTPPKQPKTTEVYPQRGRKAVTTLHYQMQWQPLPLLPAANEASSGHWLILSDRQGIGQQLSVLLEAEGQTSTLLAFNTPEQVKSVLSALLDATEQPCRGIIYLAAIDQLPLNLSIPQMLASDVEHQLHMVLTLMQTLAQRKEQLAPPLWLVTQGAQPAPHTPSLAVGQAPLWGMARTYAMEQPDVWGGAIDLDPNASHHDAVQQLLRTILTSDGEKQVAFRQKSRYVARLVPVEAPRAESFALRADCSYLVTGGLKGLGYEVSRWLARHGAQQLILLGRTPLNESSLLTNRLSELEELGVSVQYAAIDVTDAQQMAIFFNALPQKGHPPIRGVVHCASVWQDDNGNSLVRPLLQLDFAALSTVLRPKVLGTLHLAQHITNKLDFFTCFSSGASLIGSVGQSNYAAANAFLDAMAHYRSALAQPTTSINWGAISDIGFGGTTDGQKVHEYWESEGIGRISPTQMLAALERLHAHHTPQIAVMNMNWSLLFGTHPELARMAWASDVLKGQQPLKTAQVPLPTQTEDEPAKLVRSTVLRERKKAPLPTQREEKPAKPVLQTVLQEPKPALVSSDSALERIMSQQLEIMSQQLELLRANALPHAPQNAKKKATPIDVQKKASASRAEGSSLLLCPRVQFSLFYFGNYDAKLDADAKSGAEKYDLIFEAAKFADQHDFTAIWTPERHFHSFGGFSPNPSVLSAALAAKTERIHLRAGSVVLPLHHPIRVAEEWALVDNLSRGRVGISFASGWHPNDFVLAPQAFGQHRELMFQEIETVQNLWRGEAIEVQDGGGNPIQVNIYPQPVQKELPIWITVVKNPDTYRRAGELGASILTNLMGQTVEELAKNITLYRQTIAKQGQTGHVTLLLHTFVGHDLDTVRETARQPFYNYLKSSIGLFKNLVKSLGEKVDFDSLTEEDQTFFLDMAYERYVQTSALIGTPTSCAPILDKLQAIGVDEIACFIDFGLDMESVLSNLPYLNQIRLRCNA